MTTKGGSKIPKNFTTWFMDDPLCMVAHSALTSIQPVCESVVRRISPHFMSGLWSQSLEIYLHDDDDQGGEVFDKRTK